MQNRRFTWIELIISVVLLAILAVTLLPRLAGTGETARVASAAAIAGALGEAVSIAHVEWLNNGSAIVTPILLQKQNIYVNAFGWPEDTKEVAVGVVTAEKCLNLWRGLLNKPPAAVAKGAPCTGPACQYVANIRTSPSGGAVTECTYTDQQGHGSNVISYDVSTGIVSI